MDLAGFKKIIWDYTRQINENANNVLSPVCEQYSLTILQLRILMELYRYGPHTVGSLAEGIHVAGTNISAMCKKLERMKLLKRVRDRNDERVVKVVLTVKGNETVSDINSYLDEIILQSIGNEAEDTLDDIINGMQKLNNLLQKISPIKS